MDETRLSIARAAARAGGAAADERFRRSVDVETKAHKNDLVSEADRAAQEHVVERLRESSDAPVVGEEDEERTAIPEAGPAWVVDPIDGTANYLRGLRVWTTTVAAVEDGDPVAGATVMPALDDEYVAGPDETRLNGDSATVSVRDDVETFAVAVLGWGPQGQRAAYSALSSTVVERCGDMRRFGSMQSALAFVASGGLEAAVTTRQPNPWDSVAGVHLIRQAGGTVTDLEGNRWRHDSTGLVASNGRAHEAVLDVAQDAAAAGERE
ncbi:inositol monophosphatase family protein [Halorientalis salina]|uniref:inositol monophosphatase family protein n=1 Tax=Halorientalis salina TaxID=2932266 RepID=UPI0010AC7A72|nr:inositol monophosphatase [Halorientalis salina]